MPGAQMPMGPCVTCAPFCAPLVQLVASVEATFFWPQLNRSFLLTGFNNALGPIETINSAALGSVEGSFLVGPRITLGLQGECWGLVGRYWNATTWADNFTPAFPGAAQSGIILFDAFRAYTVDLEVQRRFCHWNWDLYGFLGVRYASVDNDRVMSLQNSFGTDLLTASSFAGQQFNGTGLTFGLFGLRPIFCDDGALKVYFANRYSLLWGNGSAAVQNTATAANGIAFAAATNGALAKGEGDLFIAELQFGLQWDACLKCLPGRAFLRAGWEWQYWDSNAGVVAQSNSFADVVTSQSFSTTKAGDLLFDLIGFTIGAGIMY